MQIKKLRFIVLFVVGLLFISCKKDHSIKNQTTVLNSQWVLKQNNLIIDTVKFPFSLLETLYNTQHIGDLNYEDDYQNMQIDPSAYTLTKEIHIDQKSLQDNTIKLHLSGINGHAEILINDHLVSTSTSYYSQDNLNLNKHLHAGVNVVTLKFIPTTSTQNHPNFQKGNKQNVAHTNIGCLNAFILTETAELQFKKPFLEYSNYKDSTLEAFWNIPIETYKDLSITFEWEFNGQIYSEDKKIKKGQSLQTVYFPIRNPEFWFPYTHGKPHLYKGELRVFYDGKLLQNMSLDFGVKHLKWKNTKNQIEFILNGQPIRIFAIDYNKPNWYKWATPQEIDSYIKDLKTLGINCVRVSGKEDYLREDILQRFDKAGVFVWQDLHFTHLPKTWNINSKLTIQQETIRLCETYRNHPSVLSLGGKSENHSDTTANSGLIHYEIFEQVIPEIVNTFSHLEYIPNASYVWNDGVNEFSTLSMSSYEFLDVWLREKNKDPYENAWISKMPSEQVTNDYYTYLFKVMGEPIDLESMIYYSEIHQSVSTDSLLAIKYHLNPKTIHLPVSYSESGPGIHPSITDYYGYHKALFYTLLNFNKPLSIRKSTDKETTSYLIYNNSDQPTSENINIRILNKSGKIIDELKQTISILPRQGKSILEWNPTLIPKLWASNQATCLEFKFGNQTKRVILNFGSNPIPYPDFKYRVIDQGGQQALELLSNSFIPYSKIKTSHIGYFSTNFVVLLPQDTLNIPFISQDTTYPLSVNDVNVFNYYQSFE